MEMPVRVSNLDVTGFYLNDLDSSRLLTAGAKEKYYGRLARKGNESACHKMIESNLRLVVKISRRYLNRGLPLLDLANRSAVRQGFAEKPGQMA
ncbi:MAG: hypothetical protein NZ777_20195 [Pseudomonadales bacterium]|nr:hypothetical protein [Pseudomonadales bacterium]